MTRKNITIISLVKRRKYRDMTQNNCMINTSFMLTSNLVPRAYCLSGYPLLGRQYALGTRLVNKHTTFRVATQNCKKIPEHFKKQYGDYFELQNSKSWVALLWKEYMETT